MERDVEYVKVPISLPLFSLSHLSLVGIQYIHFRSTLQRLDIYTPYGVIATLSVLTVCYCAELSFLQLLIPPFLR